jgi:hypothetical protein
MGGPVIANFAGKEKGHEIGGPDKKWRNDQKTFALHFKTEQGFGFAAKI